MTAQNTAAATNTGLTYEAFIKEVKAFGAAYGKGMNSRPAMGLRAVEAATKLADVTDDNAEKIYSEFQMAAAKAKGIEWKVEASFKVQVSKFRQFIKCGQLPSIDAVDVFNRATDIIKELTASEDHGVKGSAYDNMVNIAREQLKQPEHALTDDEIRGIVLPGDKEPKSFFEKMVAQHKALTKLHDEAPCIGAKAEIEDALQAIKNSLVEAGADADELLAPKKRGKKGEDKPVADSTSLGGAANPTPSFEEGEQLAAPPAEITLEGNEPTAIPDGMIACKNCGTHVNEDDAINGEFCSYSCDTEYAAQDHGDELGAGIE